MAKSKLRIEAREFRRKGLGIKTIANRLGVSSSTTSLWCRDIELTEEQMNQLARNAKDPYYGKRKEYLQKIRDVQEKKIEHLLQKGISAIGVLNKRELFIAGVFLYWAEGFKKDKQVGFANADSEMVRFFIKWLEICCDIPKSRLKLRVGVNEQYRDKVEEIEKYWSEILKIQRTQFQKPFFQKVQWKKTYENPENYRGVLRVRVTKSIDFLRLIYGWIEGLKNIKELSAFA